MLKLCYCYKHFENCNDKLAVGDHALPDNDMVVTSGEDGFTGSEVMWSGGEVALNAGEVMT